MTFEGATALVTGGASGIGRALAHQLGSSGARVVVADVDLGGGDGYQLDVADLDAFRRLVEEVGPIDYLFNNAGISMGGPTHEFSAPHWQRIIDVNFRGVVNGVLAAYPSMVARGRGHIVNTASAAGLVAPPFVAAYAATKHAVVGLSTALRPEAALHGVKVSVLCPGAVETPILDRPSDPSLPPTPSVTAREYMRVIRQKPVPAELVANRALRGVERNRAIIVVPPSAKTFWYLYRLSPSLAQRVAASLAKRVDRRLIRSRG